MKPEHPTREKILRATKDLLWERGFEAMSPRDVMSRSGGQGSLYHHFTGKLDLACAALAEMAAEEERGDGRDFFRPKTAVEADRGLSGARARRLARLPHGAAGQ